MRYWISSNLEYPKIEKSVYVVREGGNPLPKKYSIYELPVLLRAMVLDGWLSYREADSILELVDVDECNLDYLACVWGEPFETLCSYFYSKLDKLPENKTLDFWIVPEFQLTSYISVLLKRENSTIVLGDVELLNDEQLRFLLRFIKCNDWLCSRSLDFRFLNLADFAVLDSKANLDLFLRHHAGLRHAIERVKQVKHDYFPIRISSGTFGTDTTFKVETVKFNSGPIPRKTKLNRFEIVFGEYGELVYSILDEVLESLPMPLANFYRLFSTQDEFVKEKWQAPEVFSKMLRVGIIEVQAGSVIVTEKGLKWIAEKRRTERTKRGKS